MAKEWYPQVLSYEAGQDFKSGNTVADDDRFKFVKFNADRKIVKVSAAGDIPVGILRDDAPAGGTVGVDEQPSHASVYLSGSAAPGDAIGTTADGKAIKATTGKMIVGRVVDGGTDGDRITVVLTVPTAASA